ncbi:putative DNA helicase [Helianthus annuus]|uniref:DNA helicase n=1 Tax=Helianthus annuus TaxID=4232 RepID=A0A251U613_HELAN|nr:putative DNA helicase [Helianthus annuus]KAJ0527458.1 putative DNA helicase [Helianthus annuus]KAJ0536188.1 putative DNA helicase [Helianthus annuus]KAJ0543867.1 putative DNA helicase [Helianthus annuus]KAJ0708920.1 putative DNA helicase [Helianthus annuus]
MCSYAIDPTIFFLIDLLKYPCVFVLSKKLNGMFGICYSFWSVENLSLRFLFGNQFSMEIAGSERVNMPKSYALNMFKDFVPTCIFSEANQGRVASEGRVEHKFDMQPNNKNMEEYRRTCRERTNKSMIKKIDKYSIFVVLILVVQEIYNDRGLHMRPMPRMVGLIASNSKEKKKAAPVKAPEVKRTRRDHGELEDIMFKLFERQLNWALKQLVIETDQPAILNELCVCNKRGTNRGTYELKPEYKKSVEETGAE